MRMLGMVLLIAALAACGAPGQKEREGLVRGFQQYSGRQFDASEAAANAYIQKFPQDPHVDEAYYLRGLARYGMGNKNGALSDMNTAIQRTQRNDLKSKAYRVLGDLAYEAHRWDEAINHYKASIMTAEGPLDTYAHERLAASLQALGRWDESRPYLQKVIAARPEPVQLQRAIQRLNARYFELQFGAYQEVANARTMVGKLKAEGLAATPMSELREGKLWWLVRSGQCRTHLEADAARQRLIGKYPLVIVVP